MAIPGYDYSKTQFPGLDRTTAGLGGNIPQQTITGYTTAFYEQLFKSTRDIALLLDKTFRAGYGCLQIGSVVAMDQNTKELVPYVPETISEDDVGRVFLWTDLTSGGTSGEFDVNMMESYKLKTGDVVAIGDSDTNAETHTISTIDRASSSVKATITLNNGVTSDFTVANKANAYLKAATSATNGNWSDAKYIIDAEIDTGAGEYAKGSLGSVILSNAVLNKDVVDKWNMDGRAKIDLGQNNGNFVEDGTYYILK